MNTRMMLLALALVAVVCVVGCNGYSVSNKTYTYVAEPLPTPTSTITETITTTATETNVPTYTEVEVAPIGLEQELDVKNDIEKLAVPAFFEFGNIKPGVTIETWTSDGYVKVGDVKILYEKGKPIFVMLYNGTAETKIYAVNVINAPNNINTAYCTTEKDASGNIVGELDTYTKAPYGFEDWVTLSDNVVEISAGCARAVPFRIDIPENAVLPDKPWEFRIIITDYVEGSVSTAHEIRMFLVG